MPGENVKSNKEIGLCDDLPTKSKRVTSVNIDDLEGRICYFSLAGDLAIKAFENLKFSTFNESEKKTKLKNAFALYLNFAIIMFDHVVMHCSDPLRTEIVLEVLEEKVQWIKEGRILFIFSNDIKDIKKDYSGYIERKIKEYQGGYCSQKEANSLKQTHMTTAYYDRVTNLLENVPLFVRKSKMEEFSFRKLLLEDLKSNHQEQVIVDTDADLSQVLSLNLSLHQLMYAMKYQATNKANDYVFPNSVTKKVIKTVRAHLSQGNTIARAAIVDSLKENLSSQDLTDIQENILDAISLRMDVLYCHMNSGQQMVLEFHPSYENRSIYQLDCFMSFIKTISKSDKKVRLNDTTINNILKDKELNMFRLCYLASMADTREHINLDQHEFGNRSKKTLDTFNKISKNNIESLFANCFNSISKALNGDIK